ncbi:hypothetical protein AVEN_154067-1 [Araneus ventricosus]|uniref:Uncharacterized protein n=1 Tax=Araneus ventricosus TaxID=182803 RepID=A0A4Y2J0R3_ARAVE|nr:hypothetical protein AVEN_154067-1 [Araneus ventricosus]
MIALYCRCEWVPIDFRQPLFSDPVRDWVSCDRLVRTGFIHLNYVQWMRVAPDYKHLKLPVAVKRCRILNSVQVSNFVCCLEKSLAETFLMVKSAYTEAAVSQVEFMSGIEDSKSQAGFTYFYALGQSISFYGCMV